MRLFFILNVAAWASMSLAAMAEPSPAAASNTLKAEVKTPEAKASPSTASGFSNTICSNAGNKRRIELSGSAPCEVHYKKETENPGHNQVLWTAKNDVAYCASKAQGFVEKLAGMGWKCDKAQ